jgi:hypothetical protein
MKPCPSSIPHLLLLLLLLTLTLSHATASPSLSLSLLGTDDTTTAIPDTCERRLVDEGTPEKTYSCSLEGDLSAAVGGDELRVRGASVSVSGDRVIVGTPFANQKGPDSGSASIFVRHEGAWSSEATLSPAKGEAGERLGVAVALSGTTALVGSDSGSAYIFDRLPHGWVEQAKLSAAGGTPVDEFGAAVWVSGETAIVGAPLASGEEEYSGAAYIFVRRPDGWTQEAKLTAPDGATLDSFGAAVSVSGDRAIVTAPLADTTVSDAGAAYIFVRQQGKWTMQTKLVAPTAGPLGRFGEAVAQSGETVVVGALGAAYVFVRASGGSWTHQATLSPPGGVPDEEFGRNVWMNGETVVVGAGGEGAFAFVFTRHGEVWSPSATLSAAREREGESGLTMAWSEAESGEALVVALRRGGRLSVFSCP